MLNLKHWKVNKINEERLVKVIEDQGAHINRWNNNLFTYMDYYVTQMNVSMVNRFWISL